MRSGTDKSVPYENIKGEPTMSDNTELTLFLRRVPLGVLKKNQDGYSYTSYIENEQQTKIMDLLEAYGYSLRGSFNRQNCKLFPEFRGIINSCSRADIQERAKISPQDSMWDKLVKLSQLNWFTPNFYVQLTKNIEEERDYYLKHKNKTIEG